MIAELGQKLSAKIGLGIVLIEALALAVIGAYYVRAFGNQIDRDRLHRLQTPASLMERGWLGYDAVADASIMRHLVGEEVQTALLFGDAGNIFQSLDKDHIGRNAFELRLIDRAAITNLPATGRTETLTQGRETYSCFTRPLTAAGSQSPFLYLHVKARGTAAEEAKHALTRRFVLGSLATLAATSLAVLVLFHQLITRRLRHMGKVVARLEKGELASRVMQPPSRDEIGILGQGIDNMGRQLQQAFGDLHNKIAETNHYREELEERKNFLDTLISHLPVAVFVKDVRQNFRLCYCNRKAAELYEVTVQEAVGKDDFDLTNHEQASRIRQLEQQCVGSGKEVELPAQTYRRRDGSDVLLHTIKVPVSDSKGQPILLICMSQDISERRRAEIARQELEARLRQAQKMEAIGTLAGGIAHDFNNVLAAIVGNAELARDDLPPESPARPNLEEILKASNRAQALVEQILAFARRQEAQRQTISLRPVLEEALRLLRSTLPAMIEIRTDLDPKPCLVLADATRLHQVVMNLGTNAAHAMEERGGILFVQLQQVDHTAIPATATPLAPGQYACLSVQDTGCGMSPTIADRVFDPFFTTKGPGRGTGLGLSVVHGIVSEHGGAIRFESELGKGTTFYVYLPLIAGDMPATPVAAPASGPAELNLRVLILDDEPSVARVTQRILQHAGCATTLVYHPADAWDVLQNSRNAFDVLLTDMRMPGMTGVELARRLQPLRPALPVILVTGYNDQEVHSNACPNIKRVITKPFARNTLLDAMRQIGPEGSDSNIAT